MGKRKRTRGEPLRATLDVRPSPDQIDAARLDGQKALAAVVDSKIDQVRADAQALETTAMVLQRAPRDTWPVPHREETIAALLSLAAGMRIAASVMPDSRELPFWPEATMVMLPDLTKWLRASLKEARAASKEAARRGANVQKWEATGRADAISDVLVMLGDPPDLLRGKPERW
jgi:hypothetical protein